MILLEINLYSTSNRNMLIKLIVTAFFMSVVNIAYTQTSGIGNVISIESIAKRIEYNKETIAKYKNDLILLEEALKNRTQKLKDEIAALYKERDNIIGDMKVGARCSQCNGWKSEFEKRGENFEKHLGDVKGYAIPATTSELESTRKQYAERIALKKVQLQNIEKGDNGILKKKEDIAKMEKENETLCVSMTTHSKSYETSVFSEAKNKHNQWIESLMNYASSILIADDKITIGKATVIRYKKDFETEAEKIREQVKADTKEAQNKLTANIDINEQKIQIILTEQKEYLAPVETQLAEFRKQKSSLDWDLKKTTITPTEKDSLLKQQQQLIIQINELNKNIQQYNATVKSKISQIELENQKFKDDIWELTVSLSKKQEQEVVKVKPAYDTKIAAANDMASRATNELALARKTYADKAVVYKKNNSDYIDIVILESNRMLVAAQSVNCSVWNEVRGMVATNWNKLFPCVNNITTLAKPYSSHVFNAYCSGTSSSAYLASYKSFLSGLNPDDIKAIKENSNADWFNLITK